ncbi:MAG: M48 family metallopeptidase [Congregibacter sp.]
MDFFAQQDKARRNTRYLVVLFSLTVLALIFLVNALVTWVLWIGEDYNIYAGGSGWTGYLRSFSSERFVVLGLGIAATVALVSSVRWLQLSGGGKRVAESLGGRRVMTQTTDEHERRCLNVMEELALAANMPVPALYVLPNERGINAFAAGTTPADAVVAVTRGTLLQLERDELQGVIGHEYSHILNGDMRLGIRLAALVKGITFIGDVGHFFMRIGAYGTGRQSREQTAALPIVGLALMALGWLGSIAAGFIKAAISRQKEYLADASAVQFTRDNRGIAEALKVIGGFIPGSLVHAARAPEMSHLFFGEVRHNVWDAFDTHPPLDQRIRRLDPAWNGEFIQRSEVRMAPTPLSGDTASLGVGRAAIVTAALASVAAAKGIEKGMSGEPPAEDETPATTSDDRAESELDSSHTPIPTVLLDTIHEPLSASAVALAMLIARNGTGDTESLRIIQEQGVRGQAELVVALLPDIQALCPGQYFPLLAAAMPALKSFSTPQYRQFKTTLLGVIRADQQTSLFEWCLYQLLRHYLDPEYLSVTPQRPRFSHLGKVKGQLRQVLSLLCYLGHGDSEQAFSIACDSLGMTELKALPREECSILEFSRAVHTLAECFPLLKPRILKAMALAAADDGDITLEERELVVAVAAVMDCPPPDDIALDLH